MKAILLAGGFGTRLRPLTINTPKCLVEIAGKPLLYHWVKNLVAIGISEILVNTHYLAEQVEQFIHESEFAEFVWIAHEEVLLGTAGTLISNAKFVGRDECLLIHADNYTDADLGSFLKSHMNRPSQCLFTMMVFRTTTPERCGIVKIDHDGVVVKYDEKSFLQNGNLANGAIYALSAGFVENLNSEQDFSTEVIPQFLGRIFTSEIQGEFFDIGTPENLNLARTFAEKALN